MKEYVYSLIEPYISRELRKTIYDNAIKLREKNITTIYSDDPAAYPSTYLNQNVKPASTELSIPVTDIPEVGAPVIAPTAPLFVTTYLDAESKTDIDSLSRNIYENTSTTTIEYYLEDGTTKVGPYTATRTTFLNSNDSELLSSIDLVKLVFSTAALAINNRPYASSYIYGGYSTRSAAMDGSSHTEGSTWIADTGLVVPSIFDVFGYDLSMISRYLPDAVAPTDYLQFVQDYYDFLFGSLQTLHAPAGNNYHHELQIPKHVVEVELAFREGFISRENIISYSPWLDSILPVIALDADSKPYVVNRPLASASTTTAAVPVVSGATIDMKQIVWTSPTDTAYVNKQSIDDKDSLYIKAMTTMTAQHGKETIVRLTTPAPVTQGQVYRTYIKTVSDPASISSLLIDAVFDSIYIDLLISYRNTQENLNIEYRPTDNVRGYHTESVAVSGSASIDAWEFIYTLPANENPSDWMVVYFCLPNGISKPDAQIDGIRLFNSRDWLLPAIFMSNIEKV